MCLAEQLAELQHARSCLQTSDRLCNVQRSGSSEASGSTLLDDEQRKQNGRPVTWVGGGGLDIK